MEGTEKNSQRMGHRTVESAQSEQQRESKLRKYIYNLEDLWNYNKGLIFVP